MRVRVLCVRARLGAALVVDAVPHPLCDAVCENTLVERGHGRSTAIHCYRSLCLVRIINLAS